MRPKDFENQPGGIAPEVQCKRRQLLDQLRALGRVLVAYSGGVDSAFLAAVCQEALGDQALMVTVVSETFSLPERERASALAKQLGFRHRMVQHSALGLPAFVQNAPDRCYVCKRAIFGKLRTTAAAENIAHLLDGTTADDPGDHRPGLRAAQEAGVLSPLLELGLTKNEIRLLSREMAVSTWDQPSSACLATRIPYGETITREKLQQVDQAEQFLRTLGAGQCRVRHHGRVARIEVAPEDCLDLVMRERGRIVRHLRSLGFGYVTLDLAGYRTGSLNESL